MCMCESCNKSPKRLTKTEKERKVKNRERALKAWETIRANKRKAKNRERALKAWETIRAKQNA